MFNKEKFKKLFTLMESYQFDAIMLAPSSDLEYLIDYSGHLDERLNCLVLLKDKRYFHISPLLNYEEVKEKYPEDAIFYKWSDGEGFLDTVKKSFEDFDLIGKNIGVNVSIRAIDVLDFQEMLDCNFKNAHKMLEEYRIIKTDEEVKNMIKAGQIADEVMVDIKKFIKPGMYESEVIAEIERLYKEKGAHGLSFEPIVATGKNSSKPHYNEGTSKIEIGDSIVVDCGCRYNNVCSDTSRTFFMGEPSEKQRKIYEICKRSTLTAQEAARKGMRACDLDKIARDIIDNEGYGHTFLNRTGHGIGFSVHEAPDIKGSNKTVLDEHMAFSIEPGIYLEGEFGMRVENIVIIIDGKGVSMNNSPVDIEDCIIEV